MIPYTQKYIVLALPYMIKCPCPYCMHMLLHVHIHVYTWTCNNMYMQCTCTYSCLPCTNTIMYMHIHVHVYVAFIYTHTHRPATHLMVGNPHTPMASRRARKTSSSFNESGALRQSWARTCGCWSRCSFSLTMYWSA